MASDAVYGHGVAEGDIHVQEELEDPAGKLKVTHRPCTHSRQEVAEHVAAHSPFRSLCPHWVAGRRPNTPHRRVKMHSHLPMLCADYGFFGDEGEPMVSFLTVHIRPFGVYFAAVVDAKAQLNSLSARLWTASDSAAWSASFTALIWRKPFSL